MLELTDAIRSKWNSSGVSTLFTGGMYPQVAPENLWSGGAIKPYVIYTVIAGPPSTSVYGIAPAFYEATVQFDAYGVGHDALGQFFGQWLAALDGGLSISGGKLFHSIRVTEPFPTIQPEGALNQDVWRWTSTYRFTVSN